MAVRLRWEWASRPRVRRSGPKAVTALARGDRPGMRLSASGRVAFHGPAGLRGLPPLTRDLLRGHVEAIPDIDRSDGEEQGRQGRLVIVPGRLVPDLVGDRVRPVAKSGYGLGERQRGALGIGEVGGVAPRRHGEEPFIGLAGILEVAGVHVDAYTAAVDLAGA